MRSAWSRCMPGGRTGKTGAQSTACAKNSGMCGRVTYLIKTRPGKSEIDRTLLVRRLRSGQELPYEPVELVGSFQLRHMSTVVDDHLACAGDRLLQTMRARGGRGLVVLH